jgi:glutamate racemase
VDDAPGNAEAVRTAHAPGNAEAVRTAHAPGNAEAGRTAHAPGNAEAVRTAHALRVPPIAVFDSGVGGLPYLRAARAFLPSESFLYLADDEGFPYGTKTRREVERLVLDRCGRLFTLYRPKAIVIACNTASQAALSAVRAALPGLPVIGTVPAVKPAAESTRSGVIGVMATARAIEDPYLDSLVARYAPGIRVLREAAQDLVEFVERRWLDSSAEERRAAVEPHVRVLVEGGADRIVLACTHFLHLVPDIASAAGPGVDVVDSLDGVARHLLQVLSESKALASGGEGSGEEGLFLLTGTPPGDPAYARFAALFGLRGPASLGRP